MLSKSVNFCLALTFLLVGAMPQSQAKFFGGNKQPAIRPASSTSGVNGTQNFGGIQTPATPSAELDNQVPGQEPEQAQGQTQGQAQLNSDKTTEKSASGNSDSTVPYKKERYLDHSRLFSYDPPIDWKRVQNPFCEHDILLQPAKGNKTRNISSTTYHLHFPKNQVRKEFESIISKNLDECKVIESTDVKLPCGKVAAEIKVEGKVQGMDVKQTSYVIAMPHGIYLALQGTGPKDDDEQASKDFEEFVNSFRPAK